MITTLVALALLIEVCVIACLYLIYRDLNRLHEGMMFLVASYRSRYIMVGGYLVEVEQIDTGYRGRLADYEGVKFYARSLAGLRKEAESAIGGMLDASAPEDRVAWEGF